jgi:hypothetical protein
LLKKIRRILRALALRTDKAATAHARVSIWRVSIWRSGAAPATVLAWRRCARIRRALAVHTDKAATAHARVLMLKRQAQQKDWRGTCHRFGMAKTRTNLIRRRRRCPCRRCIRLP